MRPAPVSHGLIICERVIVEANTNGVSHIAEFSRLEADEFPFTPRAFYASALVTGSQGAGEAVLRTSHLETDEVIDSFSCPITLLDRFDELRVIFPLEGCVFAEPGTYLLTLEVDGDWVAHRRLRIDPRERET